MKSKKAKKLSDWLNQLGNPYRKQAIANCEMQNPQLLNNLSYAENKAHALKGAFVWSKSLEGMRYWGKYYNYLLKKIK